MNTLLPSLVTLGGLLLPAAWLYIRQKHTTTQRVLASLFPALFCFLIGLVFSAIFISLTGSQTDLINSLMVVLGSLLTLGLRQRFYHPKPQR